MSRLNVTARATVFSGSPVVREQAARATIAMATSDWYPIRSKAIFWLFESSMSQLTPFNTVGPFFKLLVRDRPEGTDCLVTEGTQGERITIAGHVRAGDGSAVNDGLVEIWQADARGYYHHPEDSNHAAADPEFSGFGRAATTPDGAFSFTTIKPGGVAGPEGGKAAPHVLVSVMARGVMSRCWTRMYFEGEPLNEGDPILALVPSERRHTLIARRRGHTYLFDIVLQGEHETVFFEA